jgi:tetratricopeptide (TPR) repeat protein
MSDLVITTSKSAKTRIALIGVVIVAMTIVWFATRWQVGNMVAVLTPPDDENAPAIAEFALDLAPMDPAAWTLKAATADTNGVDEYRRAAELSPADHRLRTQLGRALEQAGRLEEAHEELVTAIELAPAYAAPHWQLGNFYLRRGREADAIAELEFAARSHTLYREQVYSLVWDYFGKDADRLAELAGSDPDNNVALAYFFAGRGRGGHALAVWNRLDDDEKAARQPLARSIAHGLFIQRVYPQALEFSRQLGFDPEANFEAVTNGSFERSLDMNEDSRFNWQIARNDPKLEIATDNKIFQDGSRSLKLNFKNFTKSSLINVVQTVAVRPATTYRLRFWCRTDSLRSPGLPLIEILNANTDATIVRSAPFPNGTTEWQERAIEFSTPPECSGVTLRTVRNYCGEECALNGTVWLDTVVLTKN